MARKHITILQGDGTVKRIPVRVLRATISEFFDKVTTEELNRILGRQGHAPDCEIKKELEGM